MSSIDLSTPALKRFLVEDIGPRLGKGYRLHGRRAFVRMRGPFVQSFGLSRSRGPVLYVIPLFFVAGADPAFPVMHESLGLGSLDPHRWSFVEPKLTPDFASSLMDMLASDSPVSFFDELTDASIDEAIRWFISRTNHWSAHQFKAFIAILKGQATARADLARALTVFRKQALSDPPRDHEAALLQRYAQLEARLDRPDCIALCRADSEKHAQLLRLPPVEWPPEWPSAVAPWPKSRKGLLDRLWR